MNCPHCDSKNTYSRQSKTDLGYQEYRCRACGSQYNERTGTVFNYLEYPTEVVILVLWYYYDFKTSLDDVVRLMAQRGIELSHKTVSNWANAVGIEVALSFRHRRMGKAGNKWHADATYIKVSGRWCYFYRCIDKAGRLVDVYLSDTRDEAAATTFFQQCFDTTCVIPEQITVDGEAAMSNAATTVFQGAATVRNCKYKNNLIEQDHRGIKDWIRNKRWFKAPFAALTVCTIFEEVREHFKMSKRSRAERRGRHAANFQQFCDIAQNVA